MAAVNLSASQTMAAGSVAKQVQLAAAPAAIRSAVKSSFSGKTLIAEISSQKPANTVVRSSRVSVVAQGATFEGKPTVLVAEKLGEGGVEMLRTVANVDCSYNLTPEELCAKISLCDALIVRSATKVTREVFEASQGRLKVVGRAGVGIDNVDLQAATETGCLVVNAPTANTVAAAEHGIALLCALARNVAQADASMKRGEWKRSKYTGVSMVDKTLAVMGFGKVGSEVARRAKGLGMHVLAHDPYASADRAAAIGVELVSFDEALARADFISLHMPLTPSTDKIFNDATFSKCKKGVRIINVARGGVIDEPALIRALENGQVAQAALDVFTEEPPAANDPLVLHPNVVVTPHLGASTAEAQEGVAIEIAEAVVGALKGELSSTAVNAPMVPAEVLAELSPFVELAQKLGRLAIQLVAGSGVKDVKITYRTARSGEDLDTRLLRAMVLKGLIEPVSTSTLNLVNADYIAKQRGLRVVEERQPSDSNDESKPLESIQIQLFGVQSKMQSATGSSNDIALGGAVKDAIPHLTKVGKFETDISMEGSVLLCKNNDQPGIIGRVGTLLASHDVNISFMSVGRTGPRQSAVMALGLDEHLPAPVMHKLQQIPMIEELVFLDL